MPVTCYSWSNPRKPGQDRRELTSESSGCRAIRAGRDDQSLSRTRNAETVLLETNGFGFRTVVIADDSIKQVCGVLVKQIHEAGMRGIRAQTISERDRASRSIIDHMHIIEALETRDTELAERLVREHTFGLAEHINDYVDYLD